jgi:filamentous hemagglutinin family protein
MPSPKLLPLALAYAFSAAIAMPAQAQSPAAPTSAPAPAPTAANLPQGGVAVYGSAQFNTNAAGTHLQVTTTNGAGSNNSIINWQSFNVGAGHSTHIAQPNASSSSLNRVVTNQPSAIYGTLSSNGNVILVNQNGIAVGRGGVVDTAGFTASTLNITDEDYKSGKLRFQAKPLSEGGAGAIQVDGSVRAKGGDVILFAPQITTGKEAHVKVEGGKLIIGAGEKVEVTGRSLEGVKFIVQSADNKVINLGTLQGDAVGVFAGTLRHSGVIKAQTATLEGGRIVLKALKDIEVVKDAGSASPGSPQIIADGSAGKAGGSISIESSQGNIRIGQGALISAQGGTISEPNGQFARIQAAGGAIDIVANQGSVTTEAGSRIQAEGSPGGTIRIIGMQGASIASQISAASPGRIEPNHAAGALHLITAHDKGGAVQILSPQTVSLNTGASIDVSGDAGGGTILIGGDYQGANEDIINAQNTNVAQGVLLDASARVQGNGGKVIVWADKNTYYGGFIRATGGSEGGDGGFGETSGKKHLYFRGRADLSARRGRAGTLLLDPEEIIIAGGGGLTDPEVSPDGILLENEAGGVGTSYTISENALEAINGDVSLAALRTITIQDMSDGTLNIANGSLTLNAVNDVALSGGGGIFFQSNNIDLVISAKNGVTLTAGSVGASNAPVIQNISALNKNVLITSSAGDISISASGGVFPTPTGSVDLTRVSVKAAAGKNVNIESNGAIQLSTIPVANSIEGEQVTLKSNVIQTSGTTSLLGNVRFTTFEPNTNIEIGSPTLAPVAGTLQISQDLIDATTNANGTTLTFGGAGFTGSIFTASGVTAVTSGDRQIALVTSGFGVINNNGRNPWQTSQIGGIYAQTDTGVIALLGVGNAIGNFSAKSNTAGTVSISNDSTLTTRIGGVTLGTPGGSVNFVTNGGVPRFFEGVSGQSVLTAGRTSGSLAVGGSISFGNNTVLVAPNTGSFTLNSNADNAGQAGDIGITKLTANAGSASSMVISAKSVSATDPSTVVRVITADGSGGGFVTAMSIDASTTGGGADGVIDLADSTLLLGTGSLSLQGSMLLGVAAGLETVLSMGNGVVNGAGTIQLIGSINSPAAFPGTGNLILQAGQGTGQGTVSLDADVGVATNTLDRLDIQNSNVIFNSPSGSVYAKTLSADAGSLLTLGADQKWVIQDVISTNAAALNLNSKRLSLARSATFDSITSGGTLALDAGSIAVTVTKALASNVGLSLEGSGSLTRVILSNGIVANESTADFNIGANQTLAIAGGGATPSSLLLGGTTTVNGVLEFSQGSAGSTLVNSGTLTGGGTIRFGGRGFTNTNLLRPGDQTKAAASSLTFDRVQNTFDLSNPSSKVEIRAFGNNNNDAIHLTDTSGITQLNVRMGGSLLVTEQGAYVAAVGDGYDVLRVTSAAPPILVYAGGNTAFADAKFASGVILEAASPQPLDTAHRVQQATTTSFWDGNSDGDGDNLNWNDPLNWSNNLVPTGGNVVVDPGGAAAGTVLIGNAVNVTGWADLLFPDKNDTLQINAGGSFTTPLSATTIDAKVSLNGGTFNVNDALVLGGGLTMNGGLVNFNTAASSLTLAAGSNSVLGGQINRVQPGTGAFVINAGAQVQSSVTTVMGVTLINNGILSIDNSAFILTDDTTMYSQGSTGTLNVSGGEFRLDAANGQTVGVDGRLNLSGGTLNLVRSTMTLSNPLVWTGGNVTGLTGSILNTGGVIDFGVGVAQRNAFNAVTINTTTGATLTGELALNASSTFNIGEGSGQPFTIASNSTLTLNGGALQLDTAGLQNDGVVNITAGAGLYTSLDLAGGSTASTNGTFIVSSDRTLNFANADLTLGATAAIQGGIWEVSNGQKVTVLSDLNRGAGSVTRANGEIVINNSLTTSTLQVGATGNVIGAGDLKVTDDFDVTPGGKIGVNFNNLFIEQKGTAANNFGNLNLDVLGGKNVTLKALGNITSTSGNGAATDVFASTSLTLVGNNITLDTETPSLDLTATGNGLQSIRNTGDLNIVGFNAAAADANIGTATGGSITQSGAINVRNLDIAADKITLLGAGNTFTGLKAGAVSDISIKWSGDTVINGVSSQTNVTLVTDGALSQGAGPSKIIANQLVSIEAAAIGNPGAALQLDASRLRLSSRVGDIDVNNNKSAQIESLFAKGSARYAGPSVAITGAADVGDEFRIAASGLGPSIQSISVLANVQANKIDWDAGTSQLGIGNPSRGLPTSVVGRSSITLTAADGVFIFGGNGAGASTSLTGDGTLTIRSSGGNFLIAGGSANAAQAQVNQIQAVDIAAAVAGSNDASAQVKVLGAVDINIAGTLNIQGGAGAGAFAELDPVAGQPMVINASAVNITGGNAAGAYGAIRSGGDITINAASLTLTGGSQPDTDAFVLSTGGNLLLPAACVGCNPLTSWPLIGNGKTDVGIMNGAAYLLATTAPTPIVVTPPINSGTVVVNFNNTFNDIIDPKNNDDPDTGGGIVVGQPATCP